MREEPDGNGKIVYKAQRTQQEKEYRKRKRGTRERLVGPDKVSFVMQIAVT